MTSTPRLRFSGYPPRTARRPGPLLPGPRPRGARLDAPVARLGWVTLPRGSPIPESGGEPGEGGYAPPLCAAGLRFLGGAGFPTSISTESLRTRKGGWVGRIHEHVFGGWGWVPVEPNQGEKVRLHFLPFPQEGTHTSLNLTPKAAAWRSGVANRPHWLPPPHARTRLLGVGAGVGGRWLRRYLLGFGRLASRVPGTQATRLPLTPVREASRPTGAQGDSILLGLLLAFSSSRLLPGKRGDSQTSQADVPGEGAVRSAEGP